MINLHKFLSVELEKILALEEELWGIKARTNWFIQGERNTTFFSCFHTKLQEPESHCALKMQMGIGKRMWTGLERFSKMASPAFTVLSRVQALECLSVFMFGVIVCLNLRLSIELMLPQMQRSFLHWTPWKLSKPLVLMDCMLGFSEVLDGGRGVS